MEHNELTLLVKRLAVTRAELNDEDASLKADLEKLIADFELDNAERYAGVRELREEVAELEAQIKKLAPKVAKELGTKKPAPGVGIRTVRKLSYREADAINWAIEIGKAKDVLSIKRRPFEKIVRALEPDFVEVKEEVQVTIASNLDEQLRDAPAYEPDVVNMPF